MDRLERLLSRPAAKPYRSKGIKAGETLHLNDKGQLDFSPNDIENPKNWSNARRWYITLVSVILVVNATFASSSPSGTLEGIKEEFHVSQEVAGLVITLFLLGYCFGPLFWAPLSEFFGRRYVFYVSFTGYLVFTFLCAFSNNFAALLIGRFLTGTFASSALSNAPGVLADIWDSIERGNAMALFSMMTFVGPAMGPFIAGFLELKENWRWDFYVMLMFAGFTECLMFTLPETLPTQVLLNKAKRLRRLKIPGYENVQAPVEQTDRSLGGIFRVALTRPWKILVDPISLFVAIYLSVVYTLLYMLFTIYPIVFQQKRGWNSGVGELPLIGTAIGAGIGGAVIFAVSARDRKKQLAGYVGRPEDRLQVAMIAGVLFPVTMFWFAWTGEYNSVHWIVPTIAGVFLGTSIILIFVAYLNYLTDSYLVYAASALAANTVCRSAGGAAAPLFTQYMFDALGVGGGGSLIGGVAIVLAPIPFIFYKYGEGIRKRSKFAPTPGHPNIEEEAPWERDAEGDSSSVSSDSHHSSSDVTVAEVGIPVRGVQLEGVEVDEITKAKSRQEVDAGQEEKIKEGPERDLEKGGL
ncbi:Efflux pump FUBT [Lachnellula arida]|uniref:Efflux pump FUBT n=1 Tax=Lachnellula arida TaxID=1316785 RepID=A0A8T9B8C8_9HELO|nr:Efflux pump FUBT [Lachnellula arida]